MNKKHEQLLRRIKFIAEVKSNNFPNAKSFAMQIQQFEDEEGQPFGCSSRTIARDIKSLIEDHDAPLEYCATEKGYYLRNPDWDFKYPIFEEDFLSMAILGTRLSADILPNPLKKNVNNAVAQTVAGSSSDFFDTAMIESMLCASGIKAQIDPKIFQTLFNAWRLKRKINISYKNTKGEIAQYDFEPHIIAFNRGIWYTKGYRSNTKEIRLFAVQRILEIESRVESFQTDKKLVADTKKNGLFNYEKIKGIKLHCDASIAFYIYEQQPTFKSSVEKQDDDSLIVKLNPIAEHEVIRWILAEAGRIQVLEPEWLRKKILQAGKNIIATHS